MKGDLLSGGGSLFFFVIRKKRIAPAILSSFVDSVSDYTSLHTLVHISP